MLFLRYWLISPAMLRGKHIRQANSAYQLCPPHLRQLVQDTTSMILALRTSECLHRSLNLVPSSHLSPRIHLNLRYKYRHPLRLQGLKREKKKPRRDAVGLIGIRVASMSYDWPRRAAARYIGIPYSWNEVMRCIGRAFIHFAVHLRHSSLNCLKRLNHR